MNTICASDIKPENSLEHIKVSKSHITIDVVTPYHIELNQCNTPETILGWVMHLSEKTWMTPLILRGFVQAACKANNIQIVYG